MPIDSKADDGAGSDKNHARDFIPVVMTADEVAALLRVSPVTVYKYKDHNGLPYRQLVVGGAVRFYQHEVLAWMDRRHEAE